MIIKNAGNEIKYHHSHAVVAGIGRASCSGSEEQRRESHMAEDIGRKQAIELAGVIASDTLGAELLIIDVRAREAELRRRGAGKVADSYIGAFLNTLDSINPGLAAELQR